MEWEPLRGLFVSASGRLEFPKSSDGYNRGNPSEMTLSTHTECDPLNMSLQDHSLLGIGSWVGEELNYRRHQHLFPDFSQASKVPQTTATETLPLPLRSGPPKTRPDKKTKQEAIRTEEEAVRTAQPRNRRVPRGHSPSTFLRRSPEKVPKKKSPPKPSSNALSVKMGKQDADTQRKYAGYHHWARMGSSALSIAHDRVG